MIDYLYSGFFVLLVAAFAFWQLDLSRKREQEAYDRERETYEHIINSLSDDKHATLDRFFMSKSLPPTSVDVAAEREERIQKQKEKAERVEGLPVPHNAVDKARMDAVANEAKDLARKGAQA